jgi:hypothetical protein
LIWTPGRAWDCCWHLKMNTNGLFDRKFMFKKPALQSPKRSGMSKWGIELATINT